MMTNRVAPMMMKKRSTKLQMKLMRSLGRRVKRILMQILCYQSMSVTEKRLGEAVQLAIKNRIKSVLKANE